MKGRVVGGRYALEKRIGEGGMGIVYKGRDRVSDDVVAVKIIRSDISCESRAVQRFFREARAASSLSHEGIVRVLDEGTDVEHYIVMEYVEGVTIREWVRTFGRSSRTLVPIICDILAALHHAHSRGIIHRDIKPENIMVTPERRAKLMDFGLARPMNVRGVTITQEGAVVGTVAYMSPEQASGKRGDERSDLYSFGVVAYELFSGKRPFASDSPMNVLIKHIQETPLSPRQHNPGLSESMEGVILRLLAKRPEERYPNALEASEAFSMAADAPVARRPALSLGTELPSLAVENRTAEAKVVHGSPNKTAAPTSRSRRPAPRRGPAWPGGVLPSRRRAAETQPEPVPDVEVALLFTRVQSLQELLDQHSALEALEAVGMYERTVEAIAASHRGKVLESTGSTQVLLFDGNVVSNPVVSAVSTVKRMKEEVCELAMRSGSGDKHEKDPALFLSAGIYTRQLRPAMGGSVENPARQEMLHSAQRLHDLSATEKKYCLLCERSWERAKGEIEHAIVPFKRLWIAGHHQQIQVYELEVPMGAAG